MSLLHSTSRRLRSLFALQPIVPRVAKDIWVGVGSRGWGLGEGVDQLMEVRVRGSERVHKHSPQLFRGRQGTWGFQFDATDMTMITRLSILCVTQKRAFMPLYIVLGQ